MKKSPSDEGKESHSRRNKTEETTMPMDSITKAALVGLAIGLAMVPPFNFAFLAMFGMVYSLTNLLFSSPFDSMVIAMLLTLSLWALGFVTTITRLIKPRGKRNLNNA